MEFAFSAAVTNTRGLVGLLMGLGKGDSSIDDAGTGHGFQGVVALVSKSIVPECERVWMGDTRQHRIAVELWVIAYC